MRYCIWLYLYLSWPWISCLMDFDGQKVAGQVILLLSQNVGCNKSHNAILRELLPFGIPCYSLDITLSHLFAEDLAVGADGMSRAQVTTWSLDCERPQVDGPTFLGCWDIWELREKNVKNLKVSSRATRRFIWSWACICNAHTLTNKYKKHIEIQERVILLSELHMFYDVTTLDVGVQNAIARNPLIGPWECLVPTKVTKCHQPLGQWFLCGFRWLLLLSTTENMVQVGVLYTTRFLLATRMERMERFS